MRVRKIHLFPTKFMDFYWGFTKMFGPAPAVILILPRYWIGLLTHLQHDNPKARLSLWKPPHSAGRSSASKLWHRTSVGYQLHPRHRDDVAQLRSCGENEDDQLAKVYFRSQESLVHVSQHPGTSWVTNRWQTGMISRKKNSDVFDIHDIIDWGWMHWPGGMSKTPTCRASQSDCLPRFSRSVMDL